MLIYSLLLLLLLFSNDLFQRIHELSLISWDLTNDLVILTHHQNDFNIEINLIDIGEIYKRALK